MATGIELASVTIGGNPSKEDGKYYVPPAPANTTRAQPYEGCVTMISGSLKERDRDLDVEGMIKIRFGQQYRSISPDPHGFINSISGNRHPMVIDPAGEILVPSHSGDFDYQFIDAIARIWAAQNNGIYIPSGFGSEDKRLPFKDLLTALERVRPNYQNRDGSYDYNFQKLMHEASMKPEAFADLVQEAQYLDEVGGFKEVEGIFRERREIIGLEGHVHKRDGTKYDFSYQCEGGCFRIKLGLDMRGFGGEHLKVSRRILSSVVADCEGIERDSDKERAINWLVSEFKLEEEALYKIQANFIENKDNRYRYDKVIIRMDSPNLWSGDNSKLEQPVMQTREMLELFVPVVTAVVEGLDRLKKHQEKQREADFMDLYNIMRNQDKAVKGFS